ncbi:6-phosphogluconolactonase [Paraburkholderia sp. GAS199]|uniref:lactonase family protein n=1 Tax=Paraburkholderia sp. GAS199 TaxID=3035126 RepID=UPI003D2107A2
MNQEQSSISSLAVGTYTRRMPHVDGKGEGIYLLDFDAATGRLREVAIQKASNASYLTLSADGSRLYAVREVDPADGPGIGVYERDASSGSLRLLHETATPGGWPCHVFVDAARSLLLASNYMSGEVIAFRLDADGVPAGEPVVLSREGTGPNAQRQEGPHAHCAVASPDGRYVYLADLGTDAIVRHLLSSNGGSALPCANADLQLDAAPGAGPRHLAFTPSGAYLLANYELSNTVRLYRTEGERATLVSEVSSLPDDFKGESGAAGMRLHPSGRFVYVGNRGHDSIFGARIDEATGTLTPIGAFDLDARTPRDLAVSPDGAWLLAASQDDGFIRVFSVDQQTGVLTSTGYDYPVPSPVCIEFVREQ